jgi:hypothetical protein
MQQMAWMDLSCIENNIVLQYQSVISKIDRKTLESNYNWKNYLACLADSRFVPPIDLLT